VRARAIKETNMLHPDVSLKLTLATATIVTGYALRVTQIVTRENGESLLAVVFGILLPSLLIQVRRRCLEFGYNILSARWSTRNRVLSSSSSSSSSSRVSLILSYFFARDVVFLSGQTRARTLTPLLRVFVMCVHTLCDRRSLRSRRARTTRYSSRIPSRSVSRARR